MYTGLPYYYRWFSRDIVSTLDPEGIKRRKRRRLQRRQYINRVSI